MNFLQNIGLTPRSLRSSSDYLPDFSKPTLSTPLSEFFPSTNKNLQNQYFSIQRIRDVPINYLSAWETRWSEIQRIAKLSSTGVMLKYIDWYTDSKPGGDLCDVLIVTERIHTSLRNLHAVSKPNLLELVCMTYELSRTLSELSKHGITHQRINPDTILLIKKRNGQMKYKLSNWASWIPLNEPDYQSRIEYRNYIPPEENFHGDASKYDVYALAITFLETVGVASNYLEQYKSKSIDMNYEDPDISAVKILQRTLLNALESRKEKRMSIEGLRDRCKILLEYESELAKANLQEFCESFLNIPLVDSEYQQEKAMEDFGSSPKIKLIGGDANLQIEHEKDFSATSEMQKMFTPKKAESNVIYPLNEYGILALNGYNTRSQHDSLPKSIKIFRAILVICSLSFVIVFAGFDSRIIKNHLTNNNSKSLLELKGAIENIYMNLNSTPFSDIILAKSCPANYTQKALNVLNSSSEHYFWKNNFICVKELNPSSISYGACSYQGLTECYPGFCVSGDKCPVTQIEISVSPRTYGNWSSQNITSGDLYLNYRREKGKVPISTFDASVKQPVRCLSSNEYLEVSSSSIASPSDWSMNYDIYMQGFSGCSEYGVFPNISQFDNDSTSSYYSYQSNAGLAVTSNSKDSVSAWTYLTYTSFLVFPVTSKNYNGELFLKAGAYLVAYRNFFEKISAALNGFAVVSVITTLVALVMAFRHRHKDPGTYPRWFRLPFLCFNIVIAVLVLAVLARSHVMNKQMSEYVSFFHSLQSQSAFSRGQLSKVVTDYLDRASNLTEKSNIWLPFCVVLWIIKIVWVVMDILYRRKLKKM